MRRSTSETNRPTDAPRCRSENDCAEPVGGADRPSRIRRSRIAAMSPAARSSPAATARRSQARNARSTSASSERAIEAIGSTISGIQASASSPRRPSSATSSRNPIASSSTPTGPARSRSLRAAVTASPRPASGSTSRLARCTTVSQPRTTAIAGASVGSAHVENRAGSCGIATRTEARWATGSTMAPSGRSIPRIGTSAGGRSVRTRVPAKATANGSAEAFSTSITVNPPASGTDHTR